MRTKRVPVIGVIVLIAACSVAQQSTQQPMITNSGQAKFVSVPRLPECAGFAVEHGDPKGANSVTLINLASGCTVPMHWHSTAEELIFVSGTVQFQMQGGQSQNVSSGGYVYMPAHHGHQLTCANGCSFYRILNGPADIHYIDAAGNEISPESAMAAFGERPVSAVAQK